MEKCLHLIRKREALINALSTLAIIKMHLGKLDDSEKIHRFVLSHEYKLSNQLNMARTYTNLANVKRRKKEYGLALQSVDSSDALCARLQMNIGISINKINRAEILADSGLPQKALPFLQSAEVDFQSMPSSELSMEVSRLLARVYSQLGNTGKSDASFRKYITLRDSLLGDDRKTAIVEWEFAKEREFNARKNAELNAALLRQKFQKQNILLLTGFLAALLLAVILVLRRRQERIREKSRREKERLEFELELKSKELVAESMKALSVDQAKEGIYEKLHTLVGGLPKTHQAVFGGLFNELRRKEDDTNWEEFESRFLGVYEDFFAKLKEMAPDITPAEVRVCALMRLNMSTKEIARLSGRTQGTVDNNRSRIRKKLRLTEEENLYDFLSKL
jgi:tetratricopeptide (TPR) repeat protein